MPDWSALLRQGAHAALAPDVQGYRIERLLSEEGQGEVFLATREEDGVLVALKRWKTSSTRADREVRALRSLRHPNVVEVLDYTEDRTLGLPCLVTRYIDAPSLLADGRPIAPLVAARVIRKVALALDYVHRSGLVHRDIKPKNILLRSGHEPIVVDFGTVKFHDRVAAELTRGTQTGTGDQPLGTLPYMSPEQLRLLDHPIDERADVYSLGATFYQCLTGSHPFETNSEFERRQRDIWTSPVRGASVATVPPQLARIVDRCLAYDPIDRYPSVLAVASDLSAYLDADGFARSRRSHGDSRWRRGRVVVVVAMIAVCTAIVLGDSWGGRSGPGVAVDPAQGSPARSSASASPNPGWQERGAESRAGSEATKPTTSPLLVREGADEPVGLSNLAVGARDADPVSSGVEIEMLATSAAVTSESAAAPTPPTTPVIAAAPEAEHSSTGSSVPGSPPLPPREPTPSLESAVPDADEPAAVTDLGSPVPDADEPVAVTELGSPVPDADEPAAVTELRAVAEGPRLVILTWLPPGAPGAASVIERRGDDELDSAVLASLLEGVATYADRTAAPDTTYNYRVVTRVGAGPASSAEVVVRTPAERRTRLRDLTAVALCHDRISLSWTLGPGAREPEAAVLAIERRGGMEAQFETIAILAANATSYSDRAVDGSCTYVYRASLLVGDDRLDAVETTVRTPAPIRMVAPSGRYVVQVDADGYRVFYGDPQRWVTAYVLTRPEPVAPAPGLAFRGDCVAVREAHVDVVWDLRDPRAPAVVPRGSEPLEARLASMVVEPSYCGSCGGALPHDHVSEDQR